MKDQPSWSNYLAKTPPPRIIPLDTAQEFSFPSVCNTHRSCEILAIHQGIGKLLQIHLSFLLRVSSPVTPSRPYTPAILPLSLYLEKAKQFYNCIQCICYFLGQHDSARPSSKGKNSTSSSLPSHFPSSSSHSYLYFFSFVAPVIVYYVFFPGK